MRTKAHICFSVRFPSREHWLRIFDKLGDSDTANQEKLILSEVRITQAIRIIGGVEQQS